jgi:DNA-binding PadR family transcriptional regulator
MLDNGPKNGADIINEVENVSLGWWRPSPGSIYPLLEDMNRDGLIKKREDGKYEITDKGRDEIHWFHGPWRHEHRPVSIDEMLNEMESYVSYFEDLNNSDRQKTQVYSNRLKTIRDRLSKLVDTLWGTPPKRTGVIVSSGRMNRTARATE